MHVYQKWYIMRSLAATESGAGGPTVLHPLVTEDQPSSLSHVRCSNIDLRGFPMYITVVTRYACDSIQGRQDKAFNSSIDTINYMDMKHP